MSIGFSKMRWRLLVAKQGETFITGDNPVVINDPDDRFGQAILQSQRIEVWFPIAHDKGFLLDHSVGPDCKEQLGHSQTRLLNRRALKWAYRFVYSPRPEPWLDVAAATETFNPLRRRLKSIRNLYESTEGPIADLDKYMYSEAAVPADILAEEHLQ